MDSQLRRGMLDVCVLKSLTKGDSYGYLIVNELSLFMPMTESTLYPILRRLEEAKQVRTYTVEHNARLRKYYSITELGHNRIREFIGAWPEVIRIYEYIQGGDQHE